jgi:hypothetical protein
MIRLVGVPSERLSQYPTCFFSSIFLPLARSTVTDSMERHANGIVSASGFVREGVGFAKGDSNGGALHVGEVRRSVVTWVLKDPPAVCLWLVHSWDGRLLSDAVERHRSVQELVWGIAAGL